MTLVAARHQRGGTAMAKHRRGDGRVFQRGRRWWIAYYVAGVEHRESAGDTERDAGHRLRGRLAEIHSGRFIGPQRERVTVNELLDAYVTNCLVRGKRVVRTVSVDGALVQRGQLVSHLQEIRATFGHEPAIALTAPRIERWVADQLGRGVAPGTVQVRAKYLGAALRLAHRHRRLAEVPYFPAIQVDNTRQGFIEPDEFAALFAGLPDPINDAAHFAYLVGWRKQEILGLTWAMVDRTSRQIRLIVNKARQPRVVPLSPALSALLEKRYRVRALTPWVFHSTGERVRFINQQWNRVCRELGYWRTETGRPTKLFHDFRRTAYRNMIDAGVDPFTAMDIVGHRTTAIAKRYAIRSTRAMARALDATEAYLAGLSVSSPEGGQPEMQSEGKSRG